jgi:aminoglycoside phosphotransferase (APT) family kinase protein
LRHECDEIVKVLAENHGFHATVVDLTDSSGGFDNELFRADGDSSVGSPPTWPRQVMVRVAHRAEALQFVERVSQVHQWCGDHGYPVPAALGCGPLPNGDAYFVMPFIDAPPAMDSLFRPWRYPSFVKVFADLHLKLHEIPTTDFPAPRRTIDEILNGLLNSLSEVPAASPIIEWLLLHRRDAENGAADVVCHFDFHPLNLLWSWGTEPQVIDWDTAGIGPRAADIGFTAETFSLGGAVENIRPVGVIVGVIGDRLSRAYLRRYMSQHPTDQLEIRYWRVFQDANFLLWKEGAVFMDTVIRPDVADRWSPQFESIVLHRFRVLTG